MYLSYQHPDSYRDSTTSLFLQNFGQLLIDTALVINSWIKKLEWGEYSGYLFMKKTKRHTKKPSGKKRPPKIKPKSDDRKYYGWLGLILALTFVVYLPVFQCGFVWDDVVYVVNNPLLPSFDLGGIFSEYVAGNYHPFSMLALAVEYQFFGLEPAGVPCCKLVVTFVQYGFGFCCRSPFK